MASHPAEAGGAGGGVGGGPWTGITSAGSVSGLKLRRALFFCCSSGAPSAPWEYAPFLRDLSSRTVRELATTRVVEGILTSRRTGVEGQMVRGFAHDSGHYFYTLAWRDSAMFVPKRERRAWGLSQVRCCCNGDLVFKQQRMNTLTRDLAFLDLPNKVFGETQQ